MCSQIAGVKHWDWEIKGQDRERANEEADMNCSGHVEKSFA